MNSLRIFATLWIAVTGFGLWRVIRWIREAQVSFGFGEFIIPRGNRPIIYWILVVSNGLGCAVFLYFGCVLALAAISN
jgi:hypothetical protein